MLPLTPTKLGRYEILDEIGKGAMGVVYLAKDPLIGRLVALKTFRIGFSVRDQEADQFRARFIREAQSAGILSHPNIVTIHDVVEQAGEGLSFIAMEYVRGTNLKMVLQGEHPLPLTRVAEIVSQIAEALDYAHSQRVIHRDVKPANIIITEDGRVKITDFGIARLDTSNLTQEGQLLGTPNYMAPEQVQGKEVDHRADIFALGVVLYEMLTRHKPFQGENLTVVSHRIVYDQFTPLREYAKSVPPGVEKIISRALEKDPNRRYQRARELAEDLRKLAAEAQAGDELNETQSLSSTMVLPSSPMTASAAPAGLASAAAARRPMWSRLRERLAGSAPAAAAPAVAGPPPTASATLSGSGSDVISVSPVPALEPPPPPSATGDGSVSSLGGTGTGASSPASSPAAAPLPAPAAATGWRSPWRLALLGGGAAAILVLGVVLLWGAVRLRPSATPKVPSAPPSAASPAEIARLVDEGHGLMRHGEFQKAIAAYRKAEGLAPERTDISDMRQQAERLDVEFQQMVNREVEVVGRLAEARKALVQRRYLDAMAAAQAVLAARPGDKVAADILATAQQAETRRLKESLASKQEGPEATPAAELTPASSPAGEEVSAVVPEKIRIPVLLYVEASARGTARVFQGTAVVWDSRFRRRKTFIDKDTENRIYSGSGMAEVALRGPSLKVVVTLDGRGQPISKFLPMEQLNASTRHLYIRLLDPKTVTLDVD